MVVTSEIVTRTSQPVGVKTVCELHCSETMTARSEWCSSCIAATASEAFHLALDDIVTLALESMTPAEMERIRIEHEISLAKLHAKKQIGIHDLSTTDGVRWGVALDYPDPDGSGLIDSEPLVEFTGLTGYDRLREQAQSFADKMAAKWNLDVVEHEQ